MEFTHESLIKYLCEKVSGLGSKTADRIAGYMENIPNLLRNTHTLSQFVSSTGRRFVSDKQITEIEKIAKEYISDPSVAVKQLWISVLIKDFVKNSIDELRATSLEKLLINPFLVKAFGFHDYREVVTFYFYQKITRSVVTSWGYTVEKLLLCSGAETTELTGFDMKVVRDDRQYHLQIKSSPNTMSIEQVRQLNTHIHNIKDRVRDIPILGMSYGTRQQINTQIQSTLIGYPHSTKIGKELWDFVANEDGYCIKLLNMIDNISASFNIRFAHILEHKRLELIGEWERLFGADDTSVDEVLGRYL